MAVALAELNGDHAFQTFQVVTSEAPTLHGGTYCGISTELLEAARVDGANEVQVFRRIILPLLAPTIAVVATTVIIYALKTFDVVYTMTNGNFNTNVIANLMYQQLFNSGQGGRAAAVAVILLLAIVPVMYVNIRRFREQEAIR